MRLKDTTKNWPIILSWSCKRRKRKYNNKRENKKKNQGRWRKRIKSMNRKHSNWKNNRLYKKKVINLLKFQKNSKLKNLSKLWNNRNKWINNLGGFSSTKKYKINSSKKTKKIMMKWKISLNRKWKSSGVYLI